MIEQLGYSSSSHSASPGGFRPEKGQHLTGCFPGAYGMARVKLHT